MTDIGHGRHSLVGHHHLNGLASIQVAFGFIGVELHEIDRIDVEEEDTADEAAGPWKDKRVP
jgi:hypothetical protein